MTDQYSIVGVAVENTAFSFDKLYDYYLPPELEKAAVGCRIRISFGKSIRQGMILRKTIAGDIQNLKPVLEQLDQEPVLTEELAELAIFMKEHCFCTYFDACSAMLPPGLSVKLTYNYAAASLADLTALGEEEQLLVSYLQHSKKPVREDLLKKRFPFAETSLLTALTKKGILLRTEAVKKRISDASVKMITLTGELPARKYTPSQQEVLKVLEDMGAASVKEICYFTGVSNAVPDNLVKRGICRYFDAQPPKEDPPEKPSADRKEIVLTPQQQKAYNDLYEKYRKAEAGVSLLYGITGSGKTSVFMKLIDQVSADGRGVICMVPEISLTPQLLSGFQERYGNKVAVFHSGLSMGDRLEQWRRVRSGQATIAVGTRSAVFAPFEDVGLIVMDEEQEYSYKSSATPRFHARELAKFRCSRHHCTLLLSSATPSVESYYHAVNGRYSLGVLSSRYGTAHLPHVITVDMNRELQQGNASGYSSVLLEALEDNLAQGQQSIILLNRRGHNTFASCRQCGEVLNCPNCSISLTYHSANGRLMCHYCGYSMPLPKTCPQCGSEHMRLGGSGTQRVEQEIGELFPKARLLRMDTDSTMQRYAYETKLHAFRQGEYDIMLGTQMVAKGLDFPNVTLVGVLSADSMLHTEDFRSYERTFSLLTQVVGRSGRGGLEGRAIIQSYEPDHAVIDLAAKQNYDEFFRNEIALRKGMLYPPFADICLVVFQGKDQRKTAQAAKSFTEMFKQLAESEYANLPLRLLGPSPAGIPRISGRYRFKLIIKCRSSRSFREMMSRMLVRFGSEKEFDGVSVYADIDPENII